MCLPPSSYSLLPTAASLGRLGLQAPGQLLGKQLQGLSPPENKEQQDGEETTWVTKVTNRKWRLANGKGDRKGRGGLILQRPQEDRPQTWEALQSRRITQPFPPLANRLLHREPEEAFSVKNQLLCGNIISTSSRGWPAVHEANKAGHILSC